ncbi:iron-containing alcohol dehydrogenase, partial [Clostridium botulinum]|nr:iron-containing alcohol dehydrogenase [Clostridium botulinum]
GADLTLIDEVKEDILNAAMKDICTTANPREVTKEDLLSVLNKVIGTN